MARLQPRSRKKDINRELVHETIYEIMRGCPGSGKSRYARKLQDETNANPLYFSNECFVFSADDFHVDMGGNYNWKIERANEAHIWCFRMFTEALQQTIKPRRVIVDNTNGSLHEISPYLMFAKALRIPVRIVQMNTLISECIELQIHGVPVDILRKKYIQIEDTEIPIHFGDVEIVSWGEDESLKLLGRN